jgi:hypothetical protein
MGIAGQSMSDQNSVGAFSIESSGCFVADIHIFEYPSAIEFKRLGQQIISGFDNKTFICLLFDFDTSLK